MFKIVSNEDSVQHSVKIAGDVVSLQHTSVHGKIAPAKSNRRVMFNWHFDFTECTREEIMTIAAKSLVITMRAPFKALDAPDPKDWNDRTFSVRDWLDTERRQPVDKVARAQKAFADLTDEQIEAIIATRQK